MVALRLSTIFLSLLVVSPALAQEFQKWCGKYYQYGAPIPTTLTYTFPYPEISDTPLLDLQCTPRSSYYLVDDAQYDPPTIIIDANITNDIGQPYHGSSTNLTVTVMLDGAVLASGSVAPGTLGNLLPLSLGNLTASTSNYNFTCTAQGGGQTYTTYGALSYMVPPPWGGCGSKIDRLSGTTIVRNATAGELNWKKFYPVGFFDEIGQNSTVNPALLPLDRLYQAYENGMNLVHVRPAFPPIDVFNAYLDTLDRLGMYFVLDMSNTTSRGCEGSPKPRVAYQTIYEYDGYHPVSVTLNCENYKFIEYGIDGADQIGVDPYPINVNAAFSRVYGTPVTNYCGDSGCDNCDGSIYDVTTRIDSTINRARLAGKYRTKQAWGLPQAFNDFAETFWSAPPSGHDVIVQMVAALNHGASGLTPFDAPGAPLEAFTNASLIANMVTEYDYFFTENAASRSVVDTSLPYPGVNNLDIASWTAQIDNGTVSLIVAANFYQAQQSFNLTATSGTILNVLFGNVTSVGGMTSFIMPGNTVAAVFMQLEG